MREIRKYNKVRHLLTFSYVAGTDSISLASDRSKQLDDQVLQAPQAPVSSRPRRRTPAAAAALFFEDAVPFLFWVYDTSPCFHLFCRIVLLLGCRRLTHLPIDIPRGFRHPSNAVPLTSYVASVASRFMPLPCFFGFSTSVSHGVYCIATFCPR